MGQDGVLFYCVGAQKSGTTWLYDYLKGHPEVFLSAVKELDYFSTRRLGNQSEKISRLAKRLAAHVARPGRATAKGGVSVDLAVQIGTAIAAIGGQIPYIHLFDARSPETRAFGDISPSYSLLPAEDFREMAGIHPRTRFIFLMRDPVMRFWSSIRMLWTRSDRVRRRMTIEEVFYSRLREPSGHLVRFSRYGEIVDNLEAAVPRADIHYIFYEDLFGADGQKELDRLTAFLGLSPKIGDISKRVWSTDSKQVREDDLTDKMLEDAREVFDEDYKAIAERFGDSAPKSWFWDLRNAGVLEAASCSLQGGGL